MIKFLFFSLFSYLIGSLSSAIILCRLKNLPDPRTEGSKNPGATNVLRLGGKRLAIYVTLGDALKGFLPVFVASLFNIEGLALALIGVSAVLGHMFPLFFNFKGGKGIATAFGVFLALSWPLAVLLALTWVLVAYLFGYSSLAGITAAVLAPIYSYFVSSVDYLPAILLLSALIIFRHQENIRRLLNGTETSSFSDKN